MPRKSDGSLLILARTRWQDVKILIPRWKIFCISDPSIDGSKNVKNPNFMIGKISFREVGSRMDAPLSKVEDLISDSHEADRKVPET